MKILLVTESLGSGGAERQLVGLAKLLKDAGYETKVITWVNKNFFKDFLEDNKIEHILLKPKNKIDRVFKLAKVFKKESPDVVISYLPGPNKSAILASLIYPCKIIVSERSFSQNWNFRKKLNQVLYQRAYKIVANSNNEAENLKKHSPRLVNKIIAIPNYVDTDKFQYIERDFSQKNKKLIGVGRVIPSKNIDNLLKALAKIKEKGIDFIFEWFGVCYDKYHFSYLTNLIEELDLKDRFIFKGEVENIENEYQKADIFCMPSLLEGYPNVLVEAMATGLPVLVSNVCEIPNIIENNINGYLFNPKNIDDIANILCLGLSLTADKLHEFSINNFTKILENNTPKKFLEQYVNLL